MSPPADPKRAEIIAAIQQYAHEIAERAYPPFVEAQVIAELGMDSLSTLEMVGMIEREWAIVLPTDELHDIHTVGQLTDLPTLEIPNDALALRDAGACSPPRSRTWCFRDRQRWRSRR